MKRAYRLLASALLCLAVTTTAYSLDYPSALPNNNLGEEIKDQSDRLIPKIDWFSAAVDGQVYFRNLEVNDFYHGAGYWIQARTEFRPSEMFTLNVRSIFYAGSISGGYTKPTGQYNLFGFSVQLPQTILGGKVSGRAIDIERQTIGHGLFIEEKEMAGVWFKWARDDHFVKILKEGTGGFVFADDLNSLEVSLYGGYIGAGSIFWTASSQSSMSSNRKPFYFLNSAHTLGANIDYFVEAGIRYSKYAAMAGLKSAGTTGRLKYKTRLQARVFQDGVGEEFVGMIDNMYISYDQYDKRFSNTGNLFVEDDKAVMYSLVADFDYELNQDWSLQSKNEIGTFDYKNTQNKNFYFYRAGVTYFPMIDRQESLTFFASNKVLTDSFSRPPSEYTVGMNLPLFRQCHFIGAEANFRF